MVDGLDTPLGSLTANALRHERMLVILSGNVKPVVLQDGHRANRFWASTDTVLVTAHDNPKTDKGRGGVPYGER